MRELRAFVAAVEEGGLSAAARRLHVSQPALSRTVGGLERQVVVKPLVRWCAAAPGRVPPRRGRPCRGRRARCSPGMARPCG
ncbi:helix-turn-helix domain-containing protein [Kitasatospora sp. NPDC001159]